MDFNAKSNQKSIRVGGCTHQLLRYSPSYKTKTKNMKKKDINGLQRKK